MADIQTNMKSRLTRFAYAASRLFGLVQSAVADLVAAMEAQRYERALVPIPIRTTRPAVRRRLD